MNFILSAVLVLGAIALVSAVILYVCSKKFAVKEDPRLGQVVEVLPGANCGGCGFAGCSGLAGALVKAADAGSLEGLMCPVGGSEVMGKVADLLGMAIANAEAKVAVVRCNGTCELRQRIASYAACQFDAIHINEETGLPEVDEEKCTGCGACSKACPRNVIELRKKGPKGRRVFVSCVNKDKGAIAMKACKAACIGCGKCLKECKFEAITVENNLSYINPDKCRLCKKCVEACPTHAIKAVNFPAPKPKPAVVAKPEVEAADSPKETQTTAPKEEAVAPQEQTITKEKEDKA